MKINTKRAFKCLFVLSFIVIIVGFCVTRTGNWRDVNQFRKFQFSWMPLGLHYQMMLCLYLLGQHCLHLTFEPYLSSEFYSRKYEKLPSIVIYACTTIEETMNLFRLCLFTFRPIASKQLNRLTTLDNLSWLSGAEVKHPLWVREIPGSIPGSDKGFYVSLFCFAVFVLLFFVQKHIIWHIILQFLLQC